jgi:outer membrane protein
MKPIFSRIVFCAGLFLLLTPPPQARAETLVDVLAAAYQNNPGLQGDRAKLRATDEQVSQALSEWRPDVTAIAEGGKSRQIVDGNGILSKTGNLTPRDVGINVTQPIFRGFRTLADVRAAKATVKAQRAVLEDAEQKLLLDTAKAYLDVVQAQSVLEIDRNQEIVLRKELDETKDRLRIGELKKTDVSQAQSRLAAAMVSRLQAEGDLANESTTFARLVGRLPGKLEQPELTFELPKTQDETVTLAAHNNPEVIAAEYGVSAAHADITATEGSLLPTISLIGSATHSVEQSPLSPERADSATILARLSIPLYRTGSDYSKTRAAEQTESQKRLEFDDTRNKSREAAANAWQSLMTARAAKAGRQDVVTATSDALDGVKMESKFGTRTTLDVLNAEQELLDARINFARAEHDETLATFQLKNSIGQLTAEAMHLPVEIYDPVRNYNVVRSQWAGFSGERN